MGFKLEKKTPTDAPHTPEVGNTSGTDNTNVLKSEMETKRRENLEQRVKKLQSDKVALTAEREELKQKVAKFSSSIQKHKELPGFEQWNQKIEKWKQSINAAQISEQWEKNFEEVNKGFSEHEMQFFPQWQAKLKMLENDLETYRNNLHSSRYDITYEQQQELEKSIVHLQQTGQIFDRRLRNIKREVSKLEKSEEDFGETRERTLGKMRFDIHQTETLAGRWWEDLQKEKPNFREIIRNMVKMVDTIRTVENQFDEWE